MAVRKGYKQSELGEIPTDWRVTTLADFGEWKGGATPSMKESAFWDNGDIPWISSGDVKNVFLFDASMKITDEAIKRSSTTLMPANSIVTVTRSGILRKYFPVAMAMVKMAINQDIKALKVKATSDPLYVLYLLLWSGPRILATCMKSGTTVESVEFGWLKSFSVPSPPTKAEQEAIAKALSDADGLIESLEQLIAKKRQIKQGAMQELLTGKRRLPGFEVEPGLKQTEVGEIPKDWAVVYVGQLLSDSPRYGINAPAISYDSRYPVYLRITDITDEGCFSEKNKASVDHSAASDYLLKNGDIVFARTGASVGKSYLYNSYDGELVYAGFLIKLTPNQDKLNPFYLKSYVQTETYWGWVTENSMRSGQPGINGREFASMPIPIPHTLEEQSAIASILSDMDAESSELEDKLAKARKVKQGMMQELLTGRIRLV